MVVWTVPPGDLAKGPRFEPHTWRDPRPGESCVLRTGWCNPIVPFGIVLAGLTAVRRATSENPPQYGVRRGACASGPRPKIISSPLRKFRPRPVSGRGWLPWSWVGALKVPGHSVYDASMWLKLPSRGLVHGRKLPRNPRSKDHPTTRGWGNDPPKPPKGEVIGRRSGQRSPGKGALA